MLQLSLPSLQPQLTYPQAKLQWKRCADIPVEISHAQAVVMGEKVYVGGGGTNMVVDRHHVFQYNISRDEWSRLPPHPLIHFATAQFAGNLITVGGEDEQEGASYDIAGKVYHFKEFREWEEFLTPMPTARSCLSVATTQSAIIASGGVVGVWEGKEIPCANVEVYSSESSQWYTADPLPVPYYRMTSTTIADTYYLLGGFGDYSIPTTTVLYASLASLIEKATSPTRQSASRTSVWKTLPDTPLRVSTAASLSGHLIAVGGYKGKTSLSALAVRLVASKVGVTGPTSPELHAFFPLTNSWVRMADSDLPQPRDICTAVQLSSNAVIMIGGGDTKYKRTKTVFIGQ